MSSKIRQPKSQQPSSSSSGTPSLDSGKGAQIKKEIVGPIRKTKSTVCPMKTKVNSPTSAPRLKLGATLKIPIAPTAKIAAAPRATSPRAGVIPAILAQPPEDEKNELVIEKGYELLRKAPEPTTSHSVQSTADSLGAYERVSISVPTAEIVVAPQRKQHHRREKKTGVFGSRRRYVMVAAMIVTAFIVGILFGMGTHYYAVCHPSFHVSRKR